MRPDVTGRLDRIGNVGKCRRFDLVQKRDTAAREPCACRCAILVCPAVERPAGIERDGDAMAVGPVEEGVIIRCQVIGQERAAEKGVAALQPSAVDDREDILPG